jgi:APA family basic amino acid/polyamine antiporter
MSYENTISGLHCVASPVAMKITPPIVPFWKVMALALSAMQIGPNIAIAAGYQLTYSGLGSWVAFFCAAMLSMMVAIVLGRFASIYSVTATILSFAQRTLPRWPIAIIATCILFGYIVGPAIAITGSTIYLASLANSFGLAQAGSVVSECVITVAVSLFIGICAYRGVELSSKVSIALGVICLPLAVGITIAAANSFGFDVRSELTTSGLTIHSLPRGVFVAMAFFAGFDCVAALASETANPKRDVARTLKWTVGLCGSAVVIGALLQAPALMANVNALNAGESPTKILAIAAGFPSIALMSDVVLAMTTVSGLIAWFNAAAIIVATAANDGFLPRKLGVLDAKSGTPQRAIILLTLISTVLPTIIFAWTKSAPIIASLYMSNFIVLIWLIPYGLICAAAIWGAQSSSHPFSIRVSAVIGLVMTLSTVVAQLIFPIDHISAIVNLAGMLIVGFGTILFFRIQRKIEIGNSNLT